MSKTIYTLQEWLDKVVPYPVLSRTMGQCEMINDIIRTQVPDIIHCIMFDMNNNLCVVKFYCYVNDDGCVMFDCNPELVKAFVESITIMTPEDIFTITSRNEYRKRLLEVLKPKKF